MCYVVILAHILSLKDVYFQIVCHGNGFNYSTALILNNIACVFVLSNIFAL